MGIVHYTGFCKFVVSCKMQIQSSLVSYSNNRVIRWVWNNANLIYLISGFSILHLQTDNQLAKHCNTSGNFESGNFESG